MNSERIRQEFGSFGIDVIECRADRRIASLYSVEDGMQVCRTYADVAFNLSTVPALAPEHAMVLAGQSIGAVFKRYGWHITKHHTDLGHTTLTADDHGILALMRLDPPQELALHSYIFTVRKSGAAFDYATITERHHPQYLGVGELRAIYGEAVCSRPGRAAG